MAIKKQFGGATISKPGAYSTSSTSPSAAGSSQTTGVLLLLGEADAGPSGASEGLQMYSAAAYNQLAAKYRSGPLVDAAKASLAPSRTPGVGGAQTFLIWKTNASVQASLALLNSYATLTAKEFGVGGNRVTYQNVLSSETAPTVTGSSAVASFGGLDSETLIISQNGAAALTCTFVTPTSIGDVISQINSAITGITASSSGGKLVLTMNAATNHQRDGIGRSFEILAASTALSLLFLSAGQTVAAAEPEADITLTQPRDGLTQSGVVGGDIALMVGRTAVGSCTAASITIGASTITLTQTGATPSSITLQLADNPLIQNVVDAINQQPGWSASTTSQIGVLPSSNLDKVSSVGAFSAAGQKPARIKQDAAEVAAFIASTTLATMSAQATHGLPDNQGPASMTGGLRGASASSNFDAGLSAAMAQDLNVIVPCVSQDSSADITAGITDPSSSYDIETVQVMVDTALRLRGSVKNRKEAQGIVGYRVPTKAQAFNQAASLASEQLQLCMEDVQVVDATGTLAWKQPHILAALMAGIRCGTDIGEPLTHKYLNAQGVGHYVNPSTGVAQGDYNSLVDYEAAINAGVTSAEPNAGSWWVMLDNTTYGADASFVFNRGSVVEAAQFIAKTVRADADAAFVGRKNAIVTADTIKTRIRSILVDLFNDKITSPSTDAPQGFVESSFVVTVNGNTASVQVEVKPVQGLDFVFIAFTLGDTQQSA